MKKNLLLALSFMIISSTFAQFGLMGGAMGTQIVVAKVKQTSGDPSSLKGKKVKTVFTFDGALVSKYKVGFGKRIPESQFIEDKKAKINEKEAGKGDAWAAKWEADKVNIYPNSFNTKYNEMGKETGSSATTDDADIVLTLHTTYIEPGYFIGIDKTPAIIAVDCEFKDKSGASIASYNISNCPGQAFGFGDTDTGARMGEAYEKLAKELFKAISKKW
jgi:hypothetical protein